MLLNTQVTRTFACFGAFMLRNVFSLSAALICVKLQEYRACAGSWNYGVFGCVAFTMKGKVCKRLGYTALNYFYRYILNLFFFLWLNGESFRTFQLNFIVLPKYWQRRSSKPVFSSNAYRWRRCTAETPCERLLGLVHCFANLYCTIYPPCFSLDWRSWFRGVWVLRVWTWPGPALIWHFDCFISFHFHWFFFCFMITAAPSALLTYTLDAGETLQSGRWDKSHF